MALEQRTADGGCAAPATYRRPPHPGLKLRLDLLASREGQFAELPCDLRVRILGFALTLPALGRLAAVCRGFREALSSPGVWRKAVVSIPSAALARLAEDEHGLDTFVERFADLWGGVREVRLEPHPSRQVLEAKLHRRIPGLSIFVDAEGPYALFALGSKDLPSGSSIVSLHFYEPRYRWMCRRLFSEPSAVFGFVTSGWVHTGASGVLCQVLEHQSNPDGTYDAVVQAGASFSLLEVWSEAVPGLPHSPRLAMGFVESRPASSTAHSSELAQSRATSLMSLPLLLRNLHDSCLPLQTAARFLSKVGLLCSRRHA